MSLHKGLPLYKGGYELLMEIFQLAKGFSNEKKYTAGESLKNVTIELLILIFKTYSRYDKQKGLNKPLKGLNS